MPNAEYLMQSRHAPESTQQLTVVGVLARSVIQLRGKAMWWVLSVNADLYRSDCNDNRDRLSYLSMEILAARPWSYFSAN